MKKVRVILGLLTVLAINATAQVALNENGLYQNKDGTLFTGTLETADAGQAKAFLEIENGVLNGDAKYYFASGKLMETGSFDKGTKNGKWMRYNENGTLVALALFANGKKDGTWIVWNDEGKKIFEMHYQNGEKTGIWYNWDPSGQLLSSKDYSQGH